jgi:glutathione transport system substrate-binding protein
MKRRTLYITGSALAVAIAATIAIPYYLSTEIALYRKPTYQVPESWTPVKSLSTAENAVANLAYEGLFTIDRFLEIKPQLAESWNLDKTGITYTVKLKTGVRFHDGTQLASRHVVEMFRRLSEKDSPVRLRYERIKRVVPFDANTVKIELKSPYPPFISLLAAPAAKITHDTENTAYPMGTGAFRIVGIKDDAPTKTLVLERFEQFHGEKPAIRRIELVEATQREALDGVKSGRFHDSVMYPYFELNENEVANSQAVKQSIAGTTTWILALNSGSGPTANIQLRRCLAHNFDRKAFIARFIPEHKEAMGILPPTLMGSGHVRADDMLSESCNTFHSTTLKLIYPEVLDHGSEMCAAFGADFKKIGVKITCEGLAFGELIKRITEKKFNIAFLAQTLDLPDVEYFLESFESSAPFNLSNYKSATLDNALAAARTEPDREKRTNLFAQIDRELYRNAVTINISYPPFISYWNRCLDRNELNLAGEPYVDYSVIRAKPGCHVSGDKND